MENARLLCFKVFLSTTEMYTLCIKIYSVDFFVYFGLKGWEVLLHYPPNFVILHITKNFNTKFLVLFIHGVERNCTNLVGYIFNTISPTLLSLNSMYNSK